MNYNKLNIWLGWIIFILTSFVYISTVEPTTSFWDCGEFIATAYKLEVGHPPGAPLFMIIARVFAAFVPQDQAAMAINILSALCSSFTILFLFWTITGFAKKLALKGKESALTDGSILAILGSGAVGALAYAFSDSFWFSAVEGEVYAMSSLFTALVVWAIVKWDAAPKGAASNRWIVLIAYLIGLSIGVHLLILLAIPAIGYMIYFKNKEHTTLGFILTGVISMAVLGFIQAGIIPGTVKMLAGFEMFFVNKIGLGFHSGIIVFVILTGLLLTSLLLFSRNPKGMFKYISLALLFALILPILVNDFLGSTGIIFSMALVGLGVLLFFIKEKSPLLHISILSVMVILIGYSSFTMITIRSIANPPMDENNPENVFSMLSYLNREQYGDRPLFKGHYWMAPPSYSSKGEVLRKDGDPVFLKSYSVKKNDKTEATFNNIYDANIFLADAGSEARIVEEYIISDDKKDTELVYDDKFAAFFPRMYSRQASHVQEYIRWSGFKPRYDANKRIINKPSPGENLSYMSKFQFNWLYWRYFMWNFAGRQNDIQGHGDIADGNWLSGINFLDEQRLGNMEFLPKELRENKGYNRFYLIPLLLGVIGLVFQFFRDWKNWWIIMLLFFFTGTAIMIYLNSYPIQPRERDYVFVGSFYAFAIWIGLSVYALFGVAKVLAPSDGESPRKKLMPFALLMGGIVAAGLIGMLMNAGGASFSFTTLTYLSVIIIAGFALFAFMYFALRNAAGKTRAMVAILIGLVAPALMAFEGWDDHDRSDRRTGLDFAKNYLDSCEPNAILFTNGDNDTFPLWYAQEVEGYRTDIRVVNLSLLNTDWYVDQCKRKAYDSEPVPFSLKEPQYRQGTRDAVYVNKRNNSAVDLKEAITDIKVSKKERTPYGDFRVLKSNKLKLPTDAQKLVEKGVISEAQANFKYPKTGLDLVNNGVLNKDEVAALEVDKAKLIAGGLIPKELENAPAINGSFLIANNLMTEAEVLNIPINASKLVSQGIIKPSEANGFVDEVEWSISDNMIYKNNLMMLDLIAHFDWERPIYYAVTTGPDAYINLDPYFQLTGLAYKLTPIKHHKHKNPMILGGIDGETMYDNVMNKFSWGNMDSKEIYMDENNRRMSNTLRMQLSNLAEHLVDEGENEKAKDVLDKAMEVMPLMNVPYNRFIIPIISSYISIGDNEKALEISSNLLDMTEDKMNYYSSLEPKFLSQLRNEIDISMFITQNLNVFVTSEQLEGVDEEFTDRLETIYGQYQEIQETLKNKNSKRKKRRK